MAIEEAPYSVVREAAHYEIRKYDSVLVAETKVDSNFEKAGNIAFRRLAGYIFGNNIRKSKIAMTAPVTQAASHEKIAMTAPVSQLKVSDGFLVQFTMPKKFSLETLPSPIDPLVHIRQIPPHEVAVYRYSGSWSEKRYKQKRDEFLGELKADGVKTIGVPTLARFNSPFSLWFLRRNEIWLDLSP